MAARRLTPSLLDRPFRCCALLLVVPMVATTSAAQSNNFGVQSRADGASRMIVLAVQQAISSLPPTSSQAREYRYDSKKGTFVRGWSLGPTMFRSPQPLVPGRWAVRFATSYFALGETLGPIDYDVSGGFSGGTRFGLETHADVTVIGFSVGYGITQRLELHANLPIVITDAHASEIFLTGPNSLSVAVVPPQLIDVLLENRALRRRSLSFTDPRTGAEFPAGTNAGLGRISIGGKFRLHRSQWVQVAFAPEFYVPSPNMAELAGSDTAAISPRVTASFTMPGKLPLKLYAEAGYEYDFDNDELSFFGWTFGPSLGYRQFSLDAGVGGFEYQQGVEWTPARASYTADDGRVGIFTARGDNRLGTSFVDFLFGLKFELTEQLLLAGGVTVPLTDEGFRPDATGTIALELRLGKTVQTRDGADHAIDAPAAFAAP